jgi:hypothetical protein
MQIPHKYATTPVLLNYRYYCHKNRDPATGPYPETDEFTSSRTLSLMFILISFHLRLCLPSCSFLQFPIPKHRTRPSRCSCVLHAVPLPYSFSLSLNQYFTRSGNYEASPSCYFIPLRCNRSAEHPLTLCERPCRTTAAAAINNNCRFYLFHSE